MKIAILGAAGVRTPLIVKEMAGRQPGLGLTELALMDIDAERLELIGALTAPLEMEGRLGFKITRTTDAREALAGADYVITTFRVGGIQSRVIDERVPLGYGILGQETTGPGGFAMGMRTIPVLLHYIDWMRELCPQAWLVNFANPAGMNAEAALRAANWPRAVGICDAPSSMHQVAASLLRADPREVTLDYFGLNHLGWVRSVFYRSENLLPMFMSFIRQSGGLPEVPFSMELLDSLGMIPNEYLYYYYYSRQAVRNILAAEKTRGEHIAAWNAALFAELKRCYDAEDPEAMLAAYQAYLEQRGQTYMAAETGHQPNLSTPVSSLIQANEGGGYAGVALDLIEALNGGEPKRMVLNIQNKGAIAGMDAGDVVEIPASVTKGSIQPLAVGSIPDHCLGLMKQVKVYERLTIAAALEGSYNQALQALTLHPLVADESLARAILDDYRRRHGEFFPELK